MVGYKIMTLFPQEGKNYPMRNSTRSDIQKSDSTVPTRWKEIDTKDATNEGLIKEVIQMRQSNSSEITADDACPDGRKKKIRYIQTKFYPHFYLSEGNTNFDVSSPSLLEIDDKIVPA